MPPKPIPTQSTSIQQNASLQHNASQQQTLLNPKLQQNNQSKAPQLNTPSTTNNKMQNQTLQPLDKSGKQMNLNNTLTAQSHSNLNKSMIDPKQTLQVKNNDHSPQKNLQKYDAKVNQSVDLVKNGGLKGTYGSLGTHGRNSVSPMKAHTLKIKIDRRKLQSDLEDLRISNVVMKFDQSYMAKKLKMMMKFSTEDQTVKELANTLIRERNDNHVSDIVRNKERCNIYDDEVIDQQLRKWRREERKQQFVDAINNLVIKEGLPKNIASNKLKLLDQYEWFLSEKDSIQRVEEWVGVKLSIAPNRFATIQHLIPNDVEQSMYEDQNEKKLKKIQEKIDERDKLENEEKQTEEVQLMIQRLKEEKRARKLRMRQEKLEKLHAQEKQESLKAKRQHEIEQHEILIKRRSIQESIHRQKEERERTFQTLVEEQKKVNKNPLFKQIEYKFKDQEDSEIEKRKKHLQSLRELHQPIERSELYEHSRKMEEIVKEKIEWRKHERRNRQQNASYDYSKYQSKFLEKVLEQDAQVLEEKERLEKEKQKMLEQREVYDKYVKEMHWPKISEKKKLELEQLKASLKTPVLMKKSPRSQYGHNSYKDNEVENSTYGMLGHHRAISESHDYSSLARSRVVKWPENSMKSKPKEKKEGKIVDYLREQRIKNQEDERNGLSVSSSKNLDWKKEINRYNDSSKNKDSYDMVLEKAKDYEQKAKRKQQLLINAKGGGTVEDLMQVNDMYVESIKAKIELLHDIGRRQ
eukprot:403371232